MFPALSSSARFAAFLIAIAAIASVVMRFMWEQQTGEDSAAQSIWVMSRFFTILTTLLVAITFLVAAFRRDGVGEPWIAALTLSIVMVGAVYHALLAGLVEFAGIGLLADIGLHTIVPIACFLWWLVFGPKRTLDYGDIPMFLLWPAIYVAYALARGHFDGAYPYPFMSLNTLSAAEVTVNLAGLMIVVMLCAIRRYPATDSDSIRPPIPI